VALEPEPETDPKPHPRSLPLSSSTSTGISGHHEPEPETEPEMEPETEPEVLPAEVLPRLFDVLPMKQREHDVFITHAQASGQDQCGKLHLLLNATGSSVWYDMQAPDLTAEGMERGVSQSRVVLIFLSDGYFTRPFCVKELRWAKLYGCKLIGVVEKDTRHCPADFGLEARRAPTDLKHVLADVEFIEYQRRDFLEKAMIQELLLRAASGPPSSSGTKND
jgi:hypothetical protein